MRRSRSFVALALVAGSFAVTAQQPPMPNQPSPTQGVVKKGRVPVSGDILKAKLPKPAEVDLPNGLHLMVLEDHRLPQISFQIFIPGGGGYYDPDDRPGLASFVAALAREGTAARTSEQISQQLEVMAATLTRFRRHGRRSDGLWLVALRSIRPPARHRRRRAAAPFVLRRRARTLQAAHARTAHAATCQSGVSGGRALQPRRLRRAPGFENPHRRRPHSMPPRATTWRRSTARDTCPTTLGWPSPATSPWPKRGSSSRCAWVAGRNQERPRPPSPIPRR